MKLSLKEKEQYLIVRATDLSTLSGVPKEIMVAPYGHWKGFRGADGATIEFEITPELADMMVAYHKKLKERFPLRDLVIDYEHQTQDDTQAPAAGWMFSDVFKKEDGVYAIVKEWTKKAADYLLNKEYRYGSPVLIYNGFDKETNEKVPLRLKNLALTNEPFLDNYKPIVAKDAEPSIVIYLTDSTKPHNGGTTMLESILKLLGLAADATLDQVQSAIDKLRNSATTVAAKYTAAMKELGLKDDASVDDVKVFALKHSTLLTELGLKATDTVDQIKTAIIAAKDPGSKQVDLKDYVKRSEHETLVLQLKTRDVNDAVSAAMSKGKIAKASESGFRELALADLKKFNDLMATIPDYSAVPLKEIEAKDIKKGIDAAADPNVIDIAGKAGVTSDEIKRFGK